MMGSDYVGPVTALAWPVRETTCFCVDVEERKITMLPDGGLPIHEPGLQEVMHRNAVAVWLRLTFGVVLSVEQRMSQFMGVGAPADQDGCADCKYVLETTKDGLFKRSFSLPTEHCTTGAEHSARGARIGL